jgi:hypothetical protein
MAAEWSETQRERSEMPLLMRQFKIASGFPWHGQGRSGRTSFYRPNSSVSLKLSQLS